MRIEDMKELLIKMGLREKAAENYLRYESDVWAVLPTFRLLKPLSDDLEFYKGEYRKMLEEQMTNDILNKQMPEVAELIKEGASPEAIERFAYDLILDAYERLLYQLDDHEGAEVSEVFLEEDFSQCSYGRLMECRPDGEATGRYLLEAHGKIPFSDL